MPWPSIKQAILNLSCVSGHLSPMRISTKSFFPNGFNVTFQLFKAGQCFALAQPLTKFLVGWPRSNQVEGSEPSVGIKSGDVARTIFPCFQYDRAFKFHYVIVGKIIRRSWIWCRVKPHGNFTLLTLISYVCARSLRNPQKQMIELNNEFETVTTFYHLTLNGLASVLDVKVSR